MRKNNKCRANNLIYQIKYDIKNGVFNSRKKLIPFIATITIFCIYFVVECNSLRNNQYVNNNPTAGDMLLFIFRGMREYIPEARDPFEIPIAWIFIQLYIAFAIGNYASKDLYGFGQQMLLRSTQKKHWFIAKSVFCIGTVLLYYITSYVIIIISSLVFGNFSFHLSLDIGNWMSQIPPDILVKIDIMSFAFYVIALPIMTSIILSLVQMLFSLYIKPIFAMLIIIVYQILSAYFASDLLIGNYSMILRSSIVSNRGFNGIKVLITEIVLLIFLLVTGCLIMKKYDYIEKYN